MHLRWRDDLLTGIDEIDRQHQELFEIINRFLTACDQGKCREEVEGMLSYLEDYAAEHFSMEEQLQQEYRYPDYLSHQAIHQQFKNSFAYLKNLYLTDGASFSLAVLLDELVADWLIKHIAIVDRDLCAFLKQRMSLPKQPMANSQ